MESSFYDCARVVNLMGSSRPPGGRSEARSKGVKKRSKGVRPPPTPRQIEPCINSILYKTVVRLLKPRFIRPNRPVNQAYNVESANKTKSLNGHNAAL